MTDFTASSSIITDSLSTIPPDAIQSLPAGESRRRAAAFVNTLRQCISCCKKTLVENAPEAQSDVAGKLSQSIYWVESILSKCHEEGEMLFFTIRSEPQQVFDYWHKLPVATWIHDFNI